MNRDVKSIIGYILLILFAVSMFSIVSNLDINGVNKKSQTQVSDANCITAISTIINTLENYSDRESNLVNSNHMFFWLGQSTSTIEQSSYAKKDSRITYLINTLYLVFNQNDLFEKLDNKSFHPLIDPLKQLEANPGDSKNIDTMFQEINKIIESYTNSSSMTYIRIPNHSMCFL